MTVNLIPERVSVAGRGKSAVVIEPHIVKSQRPIRGVSVTLCTEDKPYPFYGTPADVLKWESKNDIKARLRKFYAAVAKRFKLAPKAFNIRARRNYYTLFIHLWDGAGAKTDYLKMKTVMDYVQKNARTI